MPEIITTPDAEYAFDVVKTICQEVGPGIPHLPPPHPNLFQSLDGISQID
jgi:hypothetical protein